MPVLARLIHQGSGAGCGIKLQYFTNKNAVIALRIATARAALKMRKRAGQQQATSQALNHINACKLVSRMLRKMSRQRFLPGRQHVHCKVRALHKCLQAA